MNSSRPLDRQGQRQVEDDRKVSYSHAALGVAQNGRVERFRPWHRQDLRLWSAELGVALTRGESPGRARDGKSFLSLRERLPHGLCLCVIRVQLEHRVQKLPSLGVELQVQAP